MKLLPIEGGNISDSIPGAKKGSRVKLLQIEGGIFLTAFQVQDA